MPTRFTANAKQLSPLDIDASHVIHKVAPKPNSRSSSVDSPRHEEHHERADSYSSVREAQDGLPQSFVISAKRTLSPERPGLNSNDDFESAITEDSDEPEFSSSPSDRANLGNLPAEIQERIIGNLILDLPPTEMNSRNVYLMACLLTNRKMCAATIRVLYRQVSFPTSRTFVKFMNRLKKHSELGNLVRRLDLSHIHSVGTGRTYKLNKEIQNLTSSTLLECLNATPLVQEVLANEHVAQDLDTYVLKKLLYGLRRLEALDLCASVTANFNESFSNAISRLDEEKDLDLDLQRLSLHNCSSLRAEDLELLLSRLPKLTVLDVYNTKVTDQALEQIPHSARLTHLNLGRCQSLTASGVLEFLAHHPAASSLVWLNISCDTTRWRLFEEEDVSQLLPSLPSTLRSLNINGARLTSSHVRLLRPLTRHLEELSIAYTHLSLSDISGLFAAPDDEGNTCADLSPCTLHYVDLTGVQSVSQKYLVSNGDALLSQASQPLEVIEVGGKVASKLQEAKSTNRRLGWCVKELGRRSWYVREQTDGDDGRRDWKMGSRWWGMRKTPVAWSEVGGIYGYFMFKI